LPSSEIAGEILPEKFPAMATRSLVVVLLLVAQLSAFAYAQRSKATHPAKSSWQTLDGIA